MSPEVINEIRSLLLEFQTAPEASPDYDRNMLIEERAIRFVQNEERDKNWRRPTRRNNPGFDLYRTDSDTGVTQWCEIKSLSREFKRVTMTIAEFEKARECGDSYWLYIVENIGAQNKDGKAVPAILRIRNPAGRVRSISYRHPDWRDLVK